jgi:hypothetical protein
LLALRGDGSVGAGGGHVRGIIKSPWGVVVVTMLLGGMGCGPRADPNRPVERLAPEEKYAQCQAVFRSRMSELHSCYNNYAVKTNNAKLKGHIIIGVRVGARKSPLKVWFLETTFKAKELNDCFLNIVRSWEFPTWGGYQDISFPKLVLEES